MPNYDVERTGLSRVQANGVVVGHPSPGTFTISVDDGPPQIACGSFEEALRRAGGFAMKQHARLWCTVEDGACVPLVDVRLLRKIWQDYVEMPGLRLTPEQAERLWTLDGSVCGSLLESLVDLKFLTRGRDGRYALANGDEMDPAFAAATP